MTSSKYWRTAATALAVAASIGSGSPVLAQTTDMGSAGAVVTVNGTGGDVRAGGAVVTVRGPADNVHVGGATVDIRTTATDSVWVGGAQVTIDGDIGRDIHFGGAVATIRGNIAGNLRGGGAVIEIDADVGQDVNVGGASVTFSRNATIGGDVGAGGASVNYGADAAGDVKLYGASIVFSGGSDGDVTLGGESITVGGLARIAGNLTIVTRNQPTIASSADIGGEILISEPKDWFEEGSPWMSGDPPDWAVKLFFALFLAIGTLIAGVVLLLFGGRLLGSAAGTMRHGPVSSLLLGIVTLVLVPVIGILLMMTGLGITVGIAVVALVPILLVFGHVTAATGLVAGLLGGANGRRNYGPVTAFFFLLIGSVVIGLLGLIPWVGPWIVLVILVTGTGAFSRTFFGRLRRRDDRIVAEAAVPQQPLDQSPPPPPPVVEPDTASAQAEWEQQSEGGDQPPRQQGS